MIFISDMGDALSANIPFDFLKAEIIDNVTSTNGLRHLWLWLTKRPSRMLQFDLWLKAKDITWPKNLWAMTSVTSQATVGRIRSLAMVGQVGTIRGISFEPLWSNIDLRHVAGINQTHWHIWGGESGPGAKECDIQWLVNGLDQTQAIGAHPFVKQLGSNAIRSFEYDKKGVIIKPLAKPVRFNTIDRKGEEIKEFPPFLRRRRFPI